VLYVGWLSPEKGVLELVEARRDLPLVVVGDGPLREAAELLDQAVVAWIDVALDGLHA